MNKINMATKCKLTNAMTNKNVHTLIRCVHICVTFELATTKTMDCSAGYRPMN